MQAIARKICAALGSPEAELSIVLTDDASIRQLNRTHRGKDKATDVLSFSQLEESGRRLAPPRLGRDAARGVAVLGDVVISTDTAARQAQDAGITLTQELERLLVHGVLHLLGHDHVRGGPQARRMKQEERRLLAAIAAIDRRKGRGQ